MKWYKNFRRVKLYNNEVTQTGQIIQQWGAHKGQIVQHWGHANGLNSTTIRSRKQVKLHNNDVAQTCRIVQQWLDVYLLLFFRLISLTKVVLSSSLRIPIRVFVLLGLGYIFLDKKWGKLVRLLLFSVKNLFWTLRQNL